MEKKMVVPPDFEMPRLLAGGEATIAAMDEHQYAEVGRKTLNFVRRCMRDPVLREKIQRRAAELRAQAEAEKLEGGTACGG